MPNFPLDWKERGLWQGWGAPFHVLVDEDEAAMAELAPAGERGVDVLVPVHVLLKVRDGGLVAEAYGFRMGSLVESAARHVLPLLAAAGVDEIPAPGVIQCSWVESEGKNVWGCHLWPVDGWLGSWPGLAGTQLGRPD